jgi:RNA polymerase primary sigma factor
MKMKMRKKIFGAGTGSYLNRSNLTIYLNEVRRYKGLTEEDEVYLFTKVKEGDRRAEERIIKENLRLVVSIANAYGSIMSPEDLIQEGNIGLVIAVREFDLARGYRFITFASMMIRKYILEGIANSGRLVRIPANVQTELSPNTSLDEQIGDDEDGCTRGDMLVGDIWADSSDDSLATDLARAMRATLNDRAIKVVCKVIGIGERPMFMDAIGNELGIGAERVRQIFQESLATLRKDGRVAKLLANYMD